MAVIKKLLKIQERCADKIETKSVNISTIPLIAIRVLISPAIFFREMPKTGGFFEPLIFVVFTGAIGGLLQSIFSILRLKLTTVIATGVASIIILPTLIAIFSFLGAEIPFTIRELPRII